MAYLILRLCNGRTESIQLPEGSSALVEAKAFMDQQGRWAQPWIEMPSGEFVRYDQIVGVKPSE